ncbi:MAG: DUF4012 domain-containing protein [Candidatus Dojkabacteria bacterium]
MKAKAIKIIKKDDLSNQRGRSSEVIEDDSQEPVSLRNIQREGRSNISMTLRTQGPLTPKQKKWRKIGWNVLFTSVLIGVIITGLLIYFVLIPAQRILGYVDSMQTSAVSLLTDLNKKDISNIDATFSNFESNLNNIDSELSKYEFLQNWDQTKGYYQNFQKGRTILAKIDNLSQKSLPKLKNVLQATGFKVDASQPAPDTSELNPDGTKKPSTLNLILKELPLYLNLYSEIEPDLKDIMADVKSIDPAFVPNIGSSDLKGKLEKIDSFIDDYPTLSVQTLNFLKYLPELIGSNSEKRYLLVLQNEVELRASGGIITAFGTATIKDGELQGGISLQDSWNLQLYLWGLGVPMPHDNIYGQAYLMNSGCGATEARAQDVAMYPDLYASMDWFKDYYDIANQYNPDDFPSYDHIVIINFKFAEDLLGLVQPLTVDPLGEVTADNLFQFIKSETDDPKYHGFNKDRKQILQDIADAAKKKLFDLPLDQMPKVIKTILNSFQAKDISLSTKNPDVQAFFDTYGLTARTVKDYTGDYFQFNEAQNCALKLNKWVRDSVYNQVDINDNGSINRTTWVTWTQPKIYDDSLGGQYSDSLQFSYRAWVRFFMPTGTTNIDSDGYSRSGYLYYYPQEYYDDIMDKETSDNIVWFDHRRFTDADPIEKQQMNVNYSLPDSINFLNQGKYTLIVQKHPGKSWGEANQVVINYNGIKYSVDFTLDRDKVLTFKDGIITVDNYDKRLDWIYNIVDSIPWDSIKKT